MGLCFYVALPVLDVPLHSYAVLRAQVWGLGAMVRTVSQWAAATGGGLGSWAADRTVCRLAACVQAVHKPEGRAYCAF